MSVEIVDKSLLVHVYYRNLLVDKWSAILAKGIRVSEGLPTEYEYQTLLAAAVKRSLYKGLDALGFGIVGSVREVGVIEQIRALSRVVSANEPEELDGGIEEIDRQILVLGKRFPTEFKQMLVEVSAQEAD